MKAPKIVFLSIVLLFIYLTLDFPAVKIILYASVVLVIVNRIYVVWVQKSYEVKRFLETYRVFVGVGESNNLVVSNNMKLPIPALLVNDYTDLNIAVEQNHPFLFSLNASGRELVEYQLFGRKRGQYRIGPTVVKFTDIMGIHNLAYEVNTLKQVIVYPNILKIANMPFKSMQPYGAIKNKMPIFEDPSIILGLREYNYGDEIRRINWKVSAKYDKFYVNNYQPSISSGSVILLNLLDSDYSFRNKDYHMERAIEVAASIVQELFVMRQEIGFACNCRKDNNDTLLVTEVGKGEAHFTDILTDLSVMEPCKKILFRDVADPVKLNLSWGLSLYVITPRLDETTLYKLIDFYQSGHSVTVLVVGPEIQNEHSLWNIGFQSYYSEIQGNIIHLMRV